MSDAPWRRDALGASDAPALVGVDPFKTAGDIWAVKTGRLPLEEDAGGLTPRTIGSALEPLLIDVAAHRLGRPLARQVWFQHPRAPLACSVDALALEEPAVLVETKTAGLLGPSPFLDAYGDDGTDEVPESVLVQCHHAFAVLDAQPGVPPVQGALVVALLGRRGVHCYEIRRDDDLVEQLRDMEEEWWATHVVGDRCPPQDPPSLPVLKRLRRREDVPARILDATLVGEWLNARVAKAAAEQLEETCRRFVLADLGDGEIGESVHGRVTYRATARAGYTVAPTTVRYLRFFPAKDRARAA